MKQAYVNPQMMVVKIQSRGVICNSEITNIAPMIFFGLDDTTTAPEWSRGDYGSVQDF